MSEDEEDMLAARLRDALQQEADRISPAGDGLSRIRARTGRRRLRNSWWLSSPALVLGTAVVAGVVAGGVLLTTSQDEEQTPVPPAASGSGSASTEATASESPRSRTSPSSTPAPTDSAPVQTQPSPPDTEPPVQRTRESLVYYVGETRGPAGLRLYRERTAAPQTKAVVRAALNTLLASASRDPDYVNPWAGAGKVRGISSHANTLVVDLPATVASRVQPAPLARLCLQQLVYTATEAAGRPTWGVRLRVEGRDVTSLWGQPLSSEPLTRADANAVLAPVWVTSPEEGASVDRTFQVEGEASVYEAQVTWELRARNGRVVKRGGALASEGAPGRGTWSVAVTAPPGRYELRAFEASAKDGSELSVDTKTVYVR